MKPLHYLKNSFYAVVVCAIACLSPAKAQTCTINAASNFQTIDGFGFSSAWETAPMTAAQADTFFKTGDGQLGFSLLRVQIAPNSLAYPIVSLPADTDTTAWANAITNSTLAHLRGALVLGTPWTAPATYKTNNSQVGGSLITTDYANYATYLNTAATKIDLDFVSMQNEPEASVNYESCFWTGLQMETWCQQNAPAVGPPIVMAESESFNTSYTNPTLGDSVALGNVSYIAGHLYGGTPQAPPLYGAALNAGKHVWMTEHFFSGTDITTCMTIAKEVSDCMNNQFSAYIWWRGFFSESECSLISLSTGTPLLNGDTLGQFAKYIRPGYVRCASTYSPNPNVYVTAYHGTPSLSANQFVIVATNTGTTSVSQTFSLQNVAVSSLNATRTSSTENMASVANATVANGSFTYTLPAQSITTFYTGAYAAMTPASAVLAKSQTQQLTVSGTNSSGQILTPSSFSWAITSGTGTISTTDLYTAPSVGTMATVTATTLDGSFQLASTINVVPSLVHEWEFEAGSGTVAVDSVGTANATLTGATWSTGAFNGGLALTGTMTSYGSIPAMNLNSNTVTITGWICPSGTQQYATGLVFNRACGCGLNFGPQNNTLELGYMWNANAATSNWNSGLTVPANQWSFVALVITPTNATIYTQTLGGTLQSATNAVANSTASFSGVTLLGGDSWNSNTFRYFNGKMDNVCIYNTSLSGTQVAALAAGTGASAVITPASAVLNGGQTQQLSVSGNDQNGQPVTTTSFTWTVTGGGTISNAGLYTAPATAATATVTATDGPLQLTATITATGLSHEWKLEDGSGTVAADAMGTDNASLTGASWTTGEFGNAISLSGTNTSYGSIPAMNLNSNTVTISGWINRNGTQNAWSGIVFSRASSNVSGVNFGTANELRYTWNNSGSTYNWNSGLVVPNGVWTFFALVITPTNATMYMQPAGGAMQSATNAVANSTSSFNNVTLLGGDSSATNRYFKGTMDDMRIYDASLTVSQVAMLSGLADDWSFGDGSGTTATDSGPGAHNGTVNGASWASGGGLVFNGTSSNVTFGTGPSLNGQTNFTVSAWVKTKAAAAGVIIQQRDNTSSGYLGEYQVLMNSNGTVGFFVFGPESGYQWASTITTTTVINDGNWHLVTAVRQGVAGYIYIDGTLAASSTTGTLESLSNTISVGVGADIRDLDDYFNGTISDVQIYNQALTPAQILQLNNE